MKLLTFIFGIALTTNAICTNAQQVVDSTSRKSTIKIDLTSYMLYRNAAVLSYERVIKSNQTWGITGGVQQLPGLKGINSVQVTKNTKAAGFKLGGEYRFYLQKENKFNAPRGVYMGPYTTLLNFANQRFVQVDNNGVIEEGNLKTKVSIINIGFQLGYQFLVNDRWTFDLVFVGPSVSNYRATVKLEGNINIDPDDITNEINQALLDRFPLIGDLITGNTVSSSGKASAWGFGYRYQFQVGYHFGRKKK
jgi:hypothetical protein